MCPLRTGISATNDVLPGLFKLVRRHVRDRIVIVAEDRGVEVFVLGISADDRTARSVIHDGCNVVPYRLQ
jgi:hypothetical protein